jgi:hypothetical protein
MLNNARNYENVLVYAQYLSGGLMKELVHRIAEKEGKSLREVMKEMGMSTGTIYKPLGEDAKRKILEKAFEVLDPEEVLLEIFYDIRAIYGRVIRDILEVARDETKEEILKNYNDIGIEKIEQYLTVEELKYASDIKSSFNVNTILSNILSWPSSTKEQALKPELITAYRGR